MRFINKYEPDWAAWRTVFKHIARNVLLVDLKFIFSINSEFPQWHFLKHLVIKLDGVKQLALEARTIKNVKKRLDALNHLLGFPFEECFDELSVYTRTTIARLKRERFNYSEVFMINPYEDDYAEYISARAVYSGSGRIISSSKYTKVKHPDLGSPILASHDVVVSRITNEIKTTIGPYIDEWDNIVLAGGLIAKAVMPQVSRTVNHKSDIDVFITSTETQQSADALRKIIEDLDNEDTYYSVLSSVASIYFARNPKTVQVISTDDVSPASVIARFDTSNSQWMYLHKTKEILCSPRALVGMKFGMTFIMNVTNPKRIYKSLLAGFDVCTTLEYIDVDGKNELEINDEDIEVERKKHILVWQPSSDDVFDTKEEQDEYMYEKIKLNAPGNDQIGNIVVSSNKSDVMGSFMHRGAFKGYYNSSVIMTAEDILAAYSRCSIDTDKRSLKYSNERVIIDLGETTVVDVNIVHAQKAVYINVRVPEPSIQLLDAILNNANINNDPNYVIIDRLGRIITIPIYYKYTKSWRRELLLYSKDNNKANYYERIEAGDKIRFYVGTKRYTDRRTWRYYTGLNVHTAIMLTDKAHASDEDTYSDDEEIDYNSDVEPPQSAPEEEVDGLVEYL
jgi:hypothetical protein